jgi:hypothetical protein
MSFPIKMNIPQYTFTVPSTKDKVQFRPFLVGEQKSMMLSLATEDTDTIVDSIKMLINTCSNGKIDANKLAPFDLEYLFLQLRARSIGETVNLSAACGKCDDTINFKLDISQSEVDFSNTIDKKIQLTDDIGVEMRYPTLAENIKLNAEDVKEDVLMNTTIDCIVSVWNSEDYVTTSEYPRETVIEFINTLTVPQFEKLTTFLLYVPTVKFIKKMPCPSCRTENTIRVEGLENFFG